MPAGSWPLNQIVGFWVVLVDVLKAGFGVFPSETLEGRATTAPGKGNLGNRYHSLGVRTRSSQGT